MSERAKGVIVNTDWHLFHARLIFSAHKKITIMTYLNIISFKLAANFMSDFLKMTADLQDCLENIIR